HELTKALEAEARAAGAEVLFRHALTAVTARGGDAQRGYVLGVRDADGDEVQLGCDLLVNSAGLEADRVSALCGVDADVHHPCRGDYFRIGGAPPAIDTLVYPLPRPQLEGLGVHLTIDLAGGLRLGPDTRYVAREAQQGDVDASKAEAFARGAARYLPWLHAEMLRPDTYGIRPKLSGPGEPWRDFVVRREAARGQPQLVNLLGIESPGLTASMAIAERVSRLAAETL
ncbi:MAG: FAD-dependent oxidoreductase, partial [Myxococcales bacterium]|nr:FAD-dependent oxidoreductase [Myxococcales bacterium]